MITQLAVVRPAPKAQNTMLSPFLNIPFSTQSLNARAQPPADVFPYSSIVRIH